MLMDLTSKARTAYEEMVQQMETEVEEECAAQQARMGINGSTHPNIIATAEGMLPKIFAHLGHSRTPSACSGISFCSSLISEPISENDVQEEAVNEGQNGAELSIVNLDGSDSTGKNINQPEFPVVLAPLMDIDEGHEADTEEDSKEGQARAFVPVNGHYNPLNSSADKEGKEDNDLPLFDSIHDQSHKRNSVGEMSSKLADYLEVQSTHSSKTLEECGTNHNSSCAETKLPLLQEEPENNTDCLKVDNARIECWVADTQKRIEKLQLNTSDSNSDNTAIGRSVLASNTKLDSEEKY